MKPVIITSIVSIIALICGIYLTSNLPVVNVHPQTCPYKLQYFHDRKSTPHVTFNTDQSNILSTTFDEMGGISTEFSYIDDQSWDLKVTRSLKPDKPLLYRCMVVSECEFLCSPAPNAPCNKCSARLRGKMNEQGKLVVVYESSTGLLSSIHDRVNGVNGVKP